MREEVSHPKSKTVSLNSPLFSSCSAHQKVNYCAFSFSSHHHREIYLPQNFRRKKKKKVKNWVTSLERTKKLTSPSSSSTFAFGFSFRISSFVFFILLVSFLLFLFASSSSIIVVLNCAFFIT